MIFTEPLSKDASIVHYSPTLKNQTDLNQTDDSFIFCSQEVVHIIWFVVVHTRSQHFSDQWVANHKATSWQTWSPVHHQLFI